MIHVEIPLKGGVVTVSARDLGYFTPYVEEPFPGIKYTEHPHWIIHEGRTKWGKWDSTLKRNVFIRLSRLIMKPPPHLVIHHKDGNTLNETRENLQVCTQRENMEVVSRCSRGHWSKT
jgi:hypothetical protein